MGIRGLDNWLSERGLVKEAPLSALAGTRLGIDATHYLRRLLSTRDPAASDPFVAAIGGAPLALTMQIEKDLKSLAVASVKPVFVFNGIAPQDKERPFMVEDPKPWRRAQGWELYEQGRVPEAQAEFALSTVIPADVIRIVHRLFKQRSVEFVVAPYLGWAQLVYLERHDRAYVHAIYGSNELFMFDGIDRIILNIDFASSAIQFASKAAIAADMALSHEQFLDAAILAGFEGSPTFPGFDGRVDFHFRLAIDLIKARGTGTNAAVAFKDFPFVFGYFDTFARARSLIKYSLVLVAQEGRVLPLPLVLPPPSSNTIVTAADVPSDLSEIFSAHFPDEVYYQLFRGLVSPGGLNILASGRIVEPAPLCGGTPELERYIKTLTENNQSPRCITLALLSSVLHPYWSKKTIFAVYYFDAGREYPIPHSSPVTIQSIESVSKWNVDARYVENELRRQASSTIDLSLCLGGTSTSTLAGRTIVPRNSDRLLDKKDEIVANALWRFLELRAFLTSAHQHTPYAAALHLAMKSSKVNDKFQEALYLAIELLRAGCLHNGRIGTRPYSGGPNFNGSEEDKRSMLLVMRVLSIVPLTFVPGPWTGPLSRELLVFNSFLRVTSRAMRGLLEAVAVNLLLRSDARRSREDYLDIALSLPFQSDTNTGMGILFKAYGDAFSGIAGGVDVVARAGAGTTGASEEEKQAVAAAREETLRVLQEFFPNVKNVSAELQRGMRFWQLIMLAVRHLRAQPTPAIPLELAAQFEAADSWLKPFAL